MPVKQSALPKYTIDVTVDPKSFGQTCAKLEGKEALEFWDGFVMQLTHCSHRMDGYAKDLAPKFGSSRKEAFEKIYYYLKYYEYAEDIIDSIKHGCEQRLPELNKAMK